MLGFARIPRIRQHSLGFLGFARFSWDSLSLPLEDSLRSRRRPLRNLLKNLRKIFLKPPNTFPKTPQTLSEPYPKPSLGDPGGRAWIFFEMYRFSCPFGPPRASKSLQNPPKILPKSIQNPPREGFWEGIAKCPRNSSILVSMWGPLGLHFGSIFHENAFQKSMSFLIHFFIDFGIDLGAQMPPKTS